MSFSNHLLGLNHSSSRTTTPRQTKSKSLSCLHFFMFFILPLTNQKNTVLYKKKKKYQHLTDLMTYPDSYWTFQIDVKPLPLPSTENQLPSTDRSYFKITQKKHTQSTHICSLFPNTSNLMRKVHTHTGFASANQSESTYIYIINQLNQNIAPRNLIE